MVWMSGAFLAMVFDTVSRMSGSMEEPLFELSVIGPTET
jgi:hypothetical protein